MSVEAINRIEMPSIPTITEIFENIRLNNEIGYIKTENAITFKDCGITAFYKEDEKSWMLKFHEEIEGGKFYYGVNWIGGMIEEIRVGLDSLGDD